MIMCMCEFLLLSEKDMNRWTPEDVTHVQLIIQLFEKQLLCANLFHDGGQPCDIAAGVSVISVLAKAFQWYV